MRQSAHARHTHAVARRRECDATVWTRGGLEHGPEGEHVARAKHLGCPARQRQADRAVALRDIPKMAPDLCSRQRPMLENLAKAQERLAAPTEMLGHGLRGETTDEIGAAPGQLPIAPDPFTERKAEMGSLVEPDPLEASDHVRAVRVRWGRRHEVPVVRYGWSMKKRPTRSCSLPIPAGAIRFEARRRRAFSMPPQART
jgi:hypothetical protein